MEDQENYQDLTFRDRMSTVDGKGKRIWVFPKMPSGKFYNLRRIIAYLLLLFFFIAPHIRIYGEPLILLNFSARTFIIFGVPFYPQDFHLLVLSFISLIVFIILFTVVYGRLFCGWICPQTIFMEFIYRPIEYLIDGNRRQQMILANEEMNPLKFIKRIIKHGIYFCISLATMLTFLSYIIGSEQVGELITGWPLENFSGFMVLLLFTGVHYFVYSWLREQVCTLVCPYGRLQGVMLDNNTILIAYDYKRGEPRGKGKKREKGDCIDCYSCVEVCPTGIDIRDGTQLECINCTACIDACNRIMKSVKKPPGLIRYASEKSISEGQNIRFNARAIAYSVVLFILLTVVGYSFTVRGKVETTIIRAPGTMYQEYGENRYSNLYNLQMVNKTRNPVVAELKLVFPEGEIMIIGDSLNAGRGEVCQRNLLIVIDKSGLTASNTPVKIGVYSNGRQLDSVTSTFVGPNALDKNK